jgi:hypothetical protein
MAVLRLMTLTLLFETLSAYRGAGRSSSLRRMFLYYLTQYLILGTANALPSYVGVSSFIKRARRLLMHLEGLALIFSDTQHGHAMFVALQESIFIAMFVLVASFFALAKHGHSEGKRRAILTMTELVGVTSALKPEDMESINGFPLVRQLMFCKPRKVRLFGY